MFRPAQIGLLLGLCSGAIAHLLTPPYFNLAEGKNITASATCGVDTEIPELYCKLVGANSDQDSEINLIQGQVCDVCDPNDEAKKHPPEYAVDGMETWWQSPPLSRGKQYNKVNLTIDLGQEFHVAYVYIKMGNSPRPGVWALDKSTDNGTTWTTWQYFSDTPMNCWDYFNVSANQPILQDDDVICTTEFSKIVPLEGGEILVSMLKGRPSAEHYFNSSRLQEWTRATNVRFRFLRTKTLLGHLMSVHRQDTTVTRRYFYSIKDISIGGRCMCNGHAEICDIQDPNEATKLLCQCQHNTCGPQCATCCKGFRQKKWRQSTAQSRFVCEPCNCFGHSNECEYNATIDSLHQSLDIHGNYEGGGECMNCRDNTEGINCNRCKATFYRPSNKQWNDTDVCQPCNCDSFFSTGNCAESTGKCECRPEFTPPNCDSCNYGYFGFPNCKPCECNLKGTNGYHCEATAGSCPCKENYSGRYCNECASGYYNFSECLPCDCNAIGSLKDDCEIVSGNCTCKNNYGGRTCDMCADGYFNYPSCTYCNCDNRGTESEVCEKDNGKCLCKEGYGGARCDQCLAGYYGYPNCKPCNCSTIGSSSIGCDVTGKCSCLANFASKTCDQCKSGYFNYPECTSCNCDSHGSIGASCSSAGVCECRSNFDGEKCDRCRELFYNFPTCEGCNCDPAGIRATFQGCGTLPPGELCQCKDRVEGRICNSCKPLFWNLQASNPEGCEDCQCYIPGVIGNIGECNSKSGQCNCKPSVTERSCSECVDGTYNIQESNVFGCTDCNCDIGGSTSPVCNKTSGQCPCQSRVTGLKCTEPIQTYYFPTLYQLQYEAENGRTENGNPVRYGFEQDLFPGFSWKGYAMFSNLQNKIIHDIDIGKSSLYRIILRYANPNEESFLGTITITPENPSETEQPFDVLFKPTTEPSFVTVSGIHGKPFTVVMNPGRWSITIATTKSLFLDYFVILPLEYYEATILTQDVTIPCEIGSQGLCRRFGYPSLDTFDLVLGTGGYTNRNNVRNPLTIYSDDDEALGVLNENEMPLISDQQNPIHFEHRVTKPGPYVLVVSYFTDKNNRGNGTSNVAVDINGNGKGKVVFNHCRYTTLCRQVVTDVYGKVGVYNLTSNYVTLILTAEPGTVAAIKSIAAVPQDKWSMDYLKPTTVCVWYNGECVPSTFTSTDGKKIEIESTGEVLNVGLTTVPEIYDKSARFIKLSEDNTMIDVSAKIPKPQDHPGTSVLVLHYYQPHYPEYELKVLVQNGKFYDAKVAVPHCPSIDGCRSVIEQTEDGNTSFQLDENFVITFKVDEPRSIWLDYILVIPTNEYKQNTLKRMKFDQTKEFIKKCGQNHFYIDVNETGFCRDSIFSLTSNYNNDVLYCDCDAEGSTNFECDKFGGQCPCLPNIIGRRCEICKTGFYGFPNCKPCNCPSAAFCEPETGECICPPRVTGELCDQCQPGTYGYHPIIGCEECDCFPQGTINRDVQCDLDNGNCKCKENVVGRQCDECLAGYAYYPYCDRCNCNLDGTIDTICDQQTAECHCKSNVQGPACNVCKEGTFNLRKSNRNGCSKCFCFGRTPKCTSAQLYWTFVSDMAGWGSVILSEKTIDSPTLGPVPPSQVNETTILMDQINSNNATYFSAPTPYLNKKLTSYGGNLNYTFYYSHNQYGDAMNEPDVILQGGDITLVHYSVEQPSSSEIFEHSIQLFEDNFQTVNNQPATREQMMEVLKNLQQLYIKATYFESTIVAMLSHVAMDVAMEYSFEGDVSATSVEQCQCPPNYQGLSCEDCAPGHYRVDSGTYGGHCFKCQCNGHSDSCDVETGICFDCKNGTTGDHCELCQVGYYGNATVGTPSDCMICACPLPTESNNFATGCEVSDDGNRISCDCRPGYYGALCEYCAAGYYGEPSTLGDSCKPCECSGNIDTNEIGSCDSHTGECMHCLNNTYGSACNLCAPGYFGDAVGKKDCQSCLCDRCGMDYCNNYDGICECKMNVVGEKCDRCLENHYGFKTCDGCRSCSCGLASESAQCDDDSGQCMCKPGVTGRACDRCIAGFWNYGPDGCTSCGCNTGYSIGASCDTLTGQCKCLPGVIGEKCDHCPPRYAFTVERGCFACDSCTDNLLDTTDELSYQLDPVFEKFNSGVEQNFTTQRLKYTNDTLNELSPKVNLLDPSRVFLVPIQTKVENLAVRASNLNRFSNYLKERSNASMIKGEEMFDEMSEMHENTINEMYSASGVVQRINLLVSSMQRGHGAQLGDALDEANDILTAIKQVTFTDQRDMATDKSQVANVLVETMFDNYQVPVENLNASTKLVESKIKNFTAKIDDLDEIVRKANKLAEEVENLNLENGDAVEIGNIGTVKNASSEAKEYLDDGEKMNEKSEKLLDDIDLDLMNLREDDSSSAPTQLNETIFQKDLLIKEVLEKVPAAIEHAKTLHDRSEDIDEQLYETRRTQAVRAVTAHQAILDAINNAVNDTMVADADNQNATRMSDGLRERADTLYGNYLTLINDINISQSKHGPLTRRLNDTIAEVGFMKNKTAVDSEKLDNINKSLEGLSMNPESSIFQQASDNADNVQYKIQRMKDHLNDITSGVSENLNVAKQLSTNAANYKGDMSQMNKHMDTLNRVTPNISELLDNLEQSEKRIDVVHDKLHTKINNLKDQIDRTREMVNQIKTGLTFYRNTTLELKKPDSHSSLITSNEFSVYFKTSKPNELVLFLGKEEQPGRMKRANAWQTQNEFMALVIENGYPVLIYDFGSGPVELVSDKFVSDDKWRQAIVERTGLNIKIKIREQKDDGTDEYFVREGIISGNAIFNVDPKRTKLFVGGIPPSFLIPEVISYSPFEGYMEELVIDHVPISFWNFINGANNRQGVLERDTLIAEQLTTGLRFHRPGYAAINATTLQPGKMFFIKFDFKTFEADGLLFYVGKDRMFFSLEMKNGHVIYRYSLGKDEVAIKSKEKYNDGRHHTVEALRSERNGKLTIDKDKVRTGELSGSEKSYRIKAQRFYFGGFPKDVKPKSPSVSRIGFDGCIYDVKINNNEMDLSNSDQSYRVEPGCPDKISTFVSFDENKPGYVKWPNISVSNNYQVNLKFKTLQKNGVLFVVEKDGDISALTLNDGHLLFDSQGETLWSKSATKYNDGEWHVVTANHNEQNLRLEIESDLESYGTDSNPPTLHFLYGTMYLGGVPESVRNAHANKNYEPFVGQIGDATFNGAVINFADFSERPNAQLGSSEKQETADEDMDTSEIDKTNVIEEDSSSEYPDRRKDKEDDVKEPIDFDKKPTVSTTVAPSETVDGCALPYYPQSDPEVGQALRLGTMKNSRLEYNNLRGNYRDGYAFQIDIKTMTDEGVIFYADQEDGNDLVALFMKNGQIHYAFDCGNDITVVKSRWKVNDYQWHTVLFKRESNFGEILIDDQPANAYSPETECRTDITAPFFVGGVSATKAQRVLDRIGTNKPFAGCVKDFTINGEPVGKPTAQVDVIPCSKRIEPGLFFYPGNGSNYYIADDEFVIKQKVDPQQKNGTQMSIVMEVKPRSGSGLLFAVHSKHSYVVLEMINGTVRLVIKSKHNMVETMPEPTKPITLCDGKWHTIRAIKNKKSVVLMVDSDVALGINGRSLLVSTNDPLYVGGHPDLTNLEGSISKTQFVGCIKKILIHSKEISFNQNRGYGRVLTDVCPTM